MHAEDPLPPDEAAAYAAAQRTVLARHFAEVQCLARHNMWTEGGPGDVRRVAELQGEGGHGGT